MFLQLEVPRLMQALCDANVVVQKCACVEMIHTVNSVLLSSGGSSCMSMLATQSAQDFAGVVAFLPVLPLSAVPSISAGSKRAAVNPDYAVALCDLSTLQVRLSVPLAFFEVIVSSHVCARWLRTRACARVT